MASVQYCCTNTRNILIHVHPPLSSILLPSLQFTTSPPGRSLLPFPCLFCCSIIPNICWSDLRWSSILPFDRCRAFQASSAGSTYPRNQKPPTDKMKASILAFSFCSALALAAPSANLETRQDDGYSWTPTLAGYYEKVAQHIQDARNKPGFPNAPSCELSQATLPVAPTPLPSPDGLRLAHVALGRGVQVSHQPASLHKLQTNSPT